jgi:hypothetical protein
VFPQCSDSYRTLVDALDQGGSGRDLIQRAVRHLKVFGESSTNNVGYRLVGFPRMLLQNRPETGRQRAVKSRIYPLCSVAHLFHSHFFLFETEIFGANLDFAPNQMLSTLSDATVTAMDQERYSLYLLRASVPSHI